MTQQDTLKSLKTVAKRLARKGRMPHANALDLIAQRLGQPHWNALATAWNKGWKPEETLVEAIVSPKDGEDSVMAIPVLGIGCGVEERGVLDGHPYTLEIDFEVLMGGNGWCILQEHAPSESPEIEIYDDTDTNPILNPVFRAKALAICQEAADRLRERIAVDWPRRSTKPDAEGRAQHPLFKGLAREWHCIHCNGVSTGAQMAENMWHCPKCSATPIDIFPDAFWNGTGIDDASGSDDLHPTKTKEG
jgi:hypothetical protein